MLNVDEQNERRKKNIDFCFRENREREKRELSQLNNRFASYIERVRYLERDNKKLQLEIDQLRYIVLHDIFTTFASHLEINGVQKHMQLEINTMLKFMMYDN